VDIHPLKDIVELWDSIMEEVTLLVETEAVLVQQEMVLEQVLVEMDLHG
jgi:hypothetical protein